MRGASGRACHVKGARLEYRGWMYRGADDTRVRTYAGQRNPASYGQTAVIRIANRTLNDCSDAMRHTPRAERAVADAASRH